MESSNLDFETITIKGTQSLGKTSITKSKYVIIFDKNGNCPSFFRYTASLLEVEKELALVALGEQT